MAIENIVCRGYGPSASIAFVVARGYSIGDSAPTPTPEPPSILVPAPHGGGLPPEHPRERKRRKKREAIERHNKDALIVLDIW